MSAIITALLIPLAGTVLGSAFVFFMKNEIPELFQKILLGFASGEERGMLCQVAVYAENPHMDQVPLSLMQQSHHL